MSNTIKIKRTSANVSSKELEAGEFGLKEGANPELWLGYTETPAQGETPAVIKKSKVWTGWTKIEQASHPAGYTDVWYYRKEEGLTIAYGKITIEIGTQTTRDTYYHYADWETTIPTGIFDEIPLFASADFDTSAYNTLFAVVSKATSPTVLKGRIWGSRTGITGASAELQIFAIGV